MKDFYLQLYGKSSACFKHISVFVAYREKENITEEKIKGYIEAADNNLLEFEKSDAKKAVVHQFWFKLLDNFLLHLSKYKDVNCNVYHGCNLFFNKKRSGKKEDVASIKAVWLDIDIKDTDFECINDMSAAYLEKLNKISENWWVINSGNGIQCYLMFDVCITFESFKQICFALGKFCKENSIVFDPTRLGDAGSLMRALGTKNIKNGHRKEVKILRKGSIVSFATVFSFLKQYLPETNSFSYSSPDFFDDLRYKNDANLICQKCAFINYFKETGCEEEPEWFLALSVVINCLDGDKIADTYSRSFIDFKPEQCSQYIKRFTEEKINPATCKKISEVFDGCSKCPYLNKIKSPIVLGFKQLDSSFLRDAGKKINSNVFTRSEYLISLFPIGSWVIETDGLFKKSNDSEKEEEQADKKDKKGALEFVSNVPFVIIDMICEDFINESFKTAVIAAFPQKADIIIFKLPLKLIAESSKLLAEFVGRNILISNAKALKSYLYAYLTNLKSIKVNKVVASLGWQPDDSFTYTSDGITALSDGSEYNCILDVKSKGYVKGFAQKGSFDKWVNIISLLDRSGYEPHLFSIFCACGAPLIKFTTAKGFILSLAGESGSGKTICQKVALSVWGNADICGNIGTQDTHVSMLGRLGAIKNLPVRIDEVTTFSDFQLRGLVYEIVNGRGRARAVADGGLSNTSSYWNTVALMTSNKPLLEYPVSVISDAERLRIFEINVEAPSDIVKTGKEISKIIDSNYGLLGKEVVKIIVSNIDAVVSLIDFFEKKYTDYVEFDKRFWVTCGAIVFSVADILLKNKLLKFDFNRLEAWFIQQLKCKSVELKEASDTLRGFSNREEFCSALKDSLVGSILTISEHGIITKEPNFKEIKARWVIDNKSKQSFLYVNCKAMALFVKTNFIRPLKKVLDDYGIGAAETRRFGVDVVRCYKLCFLGKEKEDRKNE